MENNRQNYEKWFCVANIEYSYIDPNKYEVINKGLRSIGANVFFGPNFLDNKRKITLFGCQVSSGVYMSEREIKKKSLVKLSNIPLEEAISQLYELFKQRDSDLDKIQLHEQRRLKNLE